MAQNWRRRGELSGGGERRPLGEEKESNKVNANGGRGEGGEIERRREREEDRESERKVATSGRVTAEAMWQVGAAQQWSGGLIKIPNSKGQRQTKLLVLVLNPVASY